MGKKWILRHTHYYQIQAADEKPCDSQTEKKNTFGKRIFQLTAGFTGLWNQKSITRRTMYTSSLCKGNWKVSCCYNSIMHTHSALAAVNSEMTLSYHLAVRTLTAHSKLFVLWTYLPASLPVVFRLKIGFGASFSLCVCPQCPSTFVSFTVPVREQII